MIPQYRAAFSLVSSSAPASPGDVEGVLLEWARHVAGSDALSTEQGSVTTENGSSWDVLRHDGPEGVFLSARLERPQRVQQTVWIVEFSLHSTGEETNAFVTVGAEQLTSGHYRPAWRVEPPRFLFTLADQFSVSAGAPLASHHALVADQAGVDELIALLNDPARELPVVCISVDNFTEEPCLSPVDTQRRLFGMAHVAFLTKRASLLLKYWLEHTVGGDLARLWGVYNGAVRVYWPGLTLNDVDASPYDHPLWLSDDIDRRFLDDLYRNIARWASLRAVPGWVDARSIVRMSNSLTRAAKGDTDAAMELLEAAERKEAVAAQLLRIADDELNTLHDQIAELQEEHKRLRRTEQAHLDQLRALRHNCDDLRRRLGDADAPEPGDWLVLSYRTGTQADRDVLEELLGTFAYAAGAIRDATRELRRPAFWAASGGRLSNLGSGLWEYRVDTKDHWIRLYVARIPPIGAVVILHGYAKQQNTLDPKETSTARDRLAALLA